MSKNTLIALSVIEIAALVGVLAFYLLVVTKLLKRVAGTLNDLAGGVAAIEQHTSIIGPGSTAANGLLQDGVTVFGSIIENATAIAKAKHN